MKLIYPISLNMNLNGKICGRHYNSHLFLLFSDPDTTYEEDMQILRVIEAYCVSSAPKNRQTIANSGRQSLIVLMQLLLYLVANTIKCKIIQKIFIVNELRYFFFFPFKCFHFLLSYVTG